MLRLFLFFFFGFTFHSFSQQEGFSSSKEKMAGLSLVAMKKNMDSSQLSPVLEVNANWCAVIPYAFLPALNQPGLVFDSEWQWLGERVEGIENSVKLLHERGIRVMVKPQIWVGHGSFTGDILMASEEDWQTFESSYQNYIMTFARIAESMNVEMLCIGNELRSVVKERPLFWQLLIREVRTIYKGKLVYAENWDAYEQVPFWKEMDYIGVNAYFPLMKGKNPKEKKLLSAWQEIKKNLAAFAMGQDRKIIFTEYGYQSTVDCAKEPWSQSKKSEESEDAQCCALNAFFAAVWNESFVQGGFLWKWYPNHTEGREMRDRYSVQGKKAEAIVRKVYGR